MEPDHPHPIDIIPADIPAVISFGDDVPFWKPGIRDVLKHLGWRWVLFLPLLLVLSALGSLPWLYHYFSGLLLFGGWKLLIFTAGISITAATTAIKSATNQRTDPFCIHCGYDLTGLDENHVCPECGRPFSLRLINEYRRDPAWFIQRYKYGKNAPVKDVPFNAGPVQRKKSRDGT